MTDPVEVTFGQRVAELRKALGLPLRAVREKSGLAISQISRVEHGKGTSLTAAVALAEALGQPLEALLIPAACRRCHDWPPSGMTCQECHKDGPRRDAG